MVAVWTARCRGVLMVTVWCSECPNSHHRYIPASTAHEYVNINMYIHIPRRGPGAARRRGARGTAAEEPGPPAKGPILAWATAT